MQSLLPARACSARPGLRIGWDSRPAGVLRSPAPRICNLTWLPSAPSRKLSVPVQAKLDEEQLVAEICRLPVHLSSSMECGLYTVPLEMVHWDRIEESERDQLTQDLLECLGVGDEAENAYQLSMAAVSLVMLKRHLPPPAATSAFSAFIRHCASSEAMKKGNWRDWGQLLHALGAAGMQCSNCPDLTRLCDQAVQLLPRKLNQSLSYKDISMPLSAMGAVDYKGSAQPLLQAVTTAISQGLFMRTASFTSCLELFRVAVELPGCRLEKVQLLDQFAAKVFDSVDAEDVSTFLNDRRLHFWSFFVTDELLALLVVGHELDEMDSRQLTIRLCSLAFLGYLDSSVRSLATKVAEADLTVLEPQHLTNLLYARSMFLAVSIHQAVSSGHSQLASEPQLDSMAAALWKECSRREADGLIWSWEDDMQLDIARQTKDACTGGQTFLTASPPSPSLQEFVAKKIEGRAIWHMKGINMEAEAWQRLLQEWV
ncbi:hypothetical protein V8C86DRAFT_968160 [Haematococcus lacustris]